MAARQRASVVKSHALMRIPAEKMKAKVHEYIARTRTRIELSCFQLPISSVLMRVAGKKKISYIYMYDMYDIYDDDDGGGDGGDDDDDDDDLRW